MEWAPIVIKLIGEVGLPLAIKVLQIWEGKDKDLDDIIDKLKVANASETLQTVIDQTPKP